MSLIYWDTMLFVYWLEQREPYCSQVQHLYERMLIRGDRLCTSSFTLGELLVAPQRQNNSELESKISDYFSSSELDVISFTPATAKSYALIRATGKASPADSIHLATAATAKADLFVTNESALTKLVVPGIQFIVGLDTSVLG